LKTAQDYLFNDNLNNAYVGLISKIMIKILTYKIKHSNPIIHHQVLILLWEVLAKSKICLSNRYHWSGSKLSMFWKDWINLLQECLLGFG